MIKRQLVYFIGRQWKHLSLLKCTIFHKIIIVHTIPLFLFLQIAPYWIQTPPTIVSLTVNQTLTLTAAALGTPAPNFHWYKDDEEIFIRSNLKIQTTSNGSQLIIEGKFIFEKWWYYRIKVLQDVYYMDLLLFFKY